jgi:Galactoside-binding lectin
MLYHAAVNTPVQLASPFVPESIAIIRSTSLAAINGSQNAAFNLLSDAGDILLHITIRATEQVIVLNSQVKNGEWGAEERISLADRFKGPNPTITIYNHGDRFQILFDYVTVKYFTKRIDKTATSIAYNADEAKGLLFSNVVTVDVLASFAELI